MNLQAITYVSLHFIPPSLYLSLFLSLSLSLSLCHKFERLLRYSIVLFTWTRVFLRKFNLIIFHPFNESWWETKDLRLSFYSRSFNTILWQESLLKNDIYEKSKWLWSGSMRQHSVQSAINILLNRLSTLSSIFVFACGRKKGSGETAQMHRLVWAFAARYCIFWVQGMNVLHVLFSSLVSCIPAFFFYMLPYK